MVIKITLLHAQRKLPDRAYIPNSWQRSSPHGTPTVLGIRFGQIGTFPVFTGRTAEELNAELGITPQQLAAMQAGSMFGWDHPTANPDHPSHQKETACPL